MSKPIDNSDKARLQRMALRITTLKNEISKPKTTTIEKRNLEKKIIEAKEIFNALNDSVTLAELTARWKKLGGNKSRRKARKQGSSKKTRSKRVRKQTRRL